MTVELKVGYEGKRRDGGKSTITENDHKDIDCAFLDDSGYWYAENGRYLISREHPYDIIGPWEEPQTSPNRPVILNPCETKGSISVDKYGMVSMDPTDSQAELTAAIKTLEQIRDAGVLK